MISLNYFIWWKNTRRFPPTPKKCSCIDGKEVEQKDIGQHALIFEAHLHFSVQLRISNSEKPLIVRHSRAFLCPVIPRSESLKLHFQTEIVTMNNSSELHILQRFHRYLFILNNFDCSSFHRRNHWRHNLPQIFSATGTALVICSILASILLAIWQIFDDDADVEKFLVAVPYACSLTRTAMGIFAMIYQKGIIVDAVERLQRVIEKCRCQTTI